MRYRIRLLTGSGRTLGTIPYEAPSHDTAVAAAVPQEENGPIEVWAEFDRGARRVYQTEGMNALR
jgi:hypothetical protein